jgi:hypothetical protein
MDGQVTDVELLFLTDWKCTLSLVHCHCMLFLPKSFPLHLLPYPPYGDCILPYFCDYFPQNLADPLFPLTPSLGHIWLRPILLSFQGTGLGIGQLHL